MKKVLLIVVSVMTVLMMSACGQSRPQGPINNPVGGNMDSEKNESGTTLSESDDSTFEQMTLGQYAETDVLRLTLVYAKLTEKVNLGHTIDDDDDYTTKLSYDSNLPCELVGKGGSAPPEGYTRVTIEYLAENLTDSDIEFDGPDYTPLIKVIYKDEKYDCKTTYHCNSSDGLNWYHYYQKFAAVPANEKKYYRCYVDIPVVVDDYEDDFLLSFSIPNSKGKTLKSLFVVTRDARVDGPEFEMASFLFESAGLAANYFTKNKDRFDPASTEEFTAALYGSEWYFKTLSPLGHSIVGTVFLFDEDYKIKEYATVNGEYIPWDTRNTSWTVDGSDLRLTGSSIESIYEMRKIKDDYYIGYVDGEAVLALTKRVE